MSVVIASLSSSWAWIRATCTNSFSWLWKKLRVFSCSAFYIAYPTLIIEISRLTRKTEKISLAWRTSFQTWYTYINSTISCIGIPNRTNLITCRHLIVVIKIKCIVTWQTMWSWCRGACCACINAAVFIKKIFIFFFNFYLRHIKLWSWYGFSKKVL